MHQTTLKKYQTRARNFYRKYCGSNTPNSAQICTALLARAHELQPNSFSTLKSALLNDQLAQGNLKAAQSIRALINPVTAPGSELPRKPKQKGVRTVSDDDFWQLVVHLRAHDFYDEALCVIEHPEMLKAITEAAQWMSNCPRTNSAIRDRLRKECRTLWPRRRQHPTLKSFRHQLGSNLKASGESDESLAYIMGHQSTVSISAYGDRRSGAGRTVYIKPAAGTDLSKVRTPNKPAAFGRGKVVGGIEIPASLSGGHATEPSSTRRPYDA